MSSSNTDKISVHSTETDKSLAMVEKPDVVEQDVIQQDVEQGLEVVLESSKEEMVAPEGNYLCQEKTSKKIESEEENNQKTFQLSHRRIIDDKHYTVTQTTVGEENEENVVETNLSGDELQEFEDKWYQLWNPQL